MAKESTVVAQKKTGPFKAKLYNMKNNIFIILIIIIAMASFFGFHPLFSLFKDSAAQAFAAAIFGTIFTTLLMLFLLKKQTELSQSSERSQVVFQEKVALFNGIIEVIETCFANDKISKEEKSKFPSIMTRLTMLATDETILAFYSLYAEIQNEDLDQAADGTINVTPEHREKLLNFTKKCRKELGLGELEGIGGMFKKQDAELLKESIISVQTEETTNGKRITYANWDEFAREQSAKDELKKRFMPIAKNVHDLINLAFKGKGITIDTRYGGGTFSFSVPKGKEKTNKRTFATFGLINMRKDSCYLQGLYKNEKDKLPNGAMYFRPSNEEQFQYSFNSIEDFNEKSKSIESAVITSYKLLAK